MSDDAVTRSANHQDDIHSRVRAVLFRLLRNAGTEVEDWTQGVEFTHEREFGQVIVRFNISERFLEWSVRTSR